MSLLTAVGIQLLLLDFCSCLSLLTFHHLVLRCVLVAQRPVDWLTDCGGGVSGEKRCWEAKPKVLNSSDTIIFMLFWKEHQCLPNYAELRIIMVHKDKNRERRWQTPEANIFKSHLSIFFFIDFETPWKLQVRPRKGKYDGRQSVVEWWSCADPSLKGRFW